MRLGGAFQRLAVPTVLTVVAILGEQRLSGHRASRARALKPHRRLDAIRRCDPRSAAWKRGQSHQRDETRSRLDVPESSHAGKAIIPVAIREVGLRCSAGRSRCRKRSAGARTPGHAPFPRRSLRIARGRAVVWEIRPLRWRCFGLLSAARCTALVTHRRDLHDGAGRRDAETIGTPIVTASRAFRSLSRWLFRSLSSR